MLNCPSIWHHTMYKSAAIQPPNSYIHTGSGTHEPGSHDQKAVTWPQFDRWPYCLVPTGQFMRKPTGKGRQLTFL